MSVWLPDDIDCWDYFSNDSFQNLVFGKWFIGSFFTPTSVGIFERTSMPGAPKSLEENPANLIFLH